MQQLKEVWKRLPEAAQDYWREQFSSSRKQSDLRTEILTKFKIKLSTDGKLTLFRAWLKDQDKRDAQAERMKENERRLVEEHPDWTLDQVREEVLKQSYFEALATGDHKLGLQTVDRDLSAKKVAVDREKLELLKTKAAQLDQIKALRDPKAALNDADRKAIVDKVDEIMGLK